MPAAGPIFIIGAMGSGTTLLRLILDSHPHIAVPQETGFMRAYNAHQFIPFKWSGRNWAKRMGWSREELDEELRAFYDRIFMRYVERHGKRRWGEKTPLHTWHIDDMARVFPDSVFVAIVRHPGGGIGSNIGRWNQPVSKAVSHYRRYTREIARQAARHGDRFALLRYEELVLRPEPVLRELLDWLGEPWSDQVLEHHAVQGSRGGRLQVEGRSRVDDPIDVSRIDKWTRTLGEGQRRYLGKRLRGLAEFYGYDVGDPAVLQPLRADGALLVRGTDIEARIDRFPALDLLTAGDPPLADRFLHPGKINPRTSDRAKPPPPPPSGLRRRLLPVWRRVPPGVRRRLKRALR